MKLRKPIRGNFHIELSSLKFRLGLIMGAIFNRKQISIRGSLVIISEDIVKRVLRNRS